jgi:uncharacterized protein (TIGR00369 family)
MPDTSDDAGPKASHAAQAAVSAALPRSPLDDRLGIEVLEASAHRVVARMPVAGNTQPFGLLHGGASCVLAESVGSILATMHGHPTHVAVGVDINCTHHRAVRSGAVIGTGTILRAGRTIVSLQIAIADEDGEPVATARLTCLLQPRRSAPA